MLWHRATIAATSIGILCLVIPGFVVSCSTSASAPSSSTLQRLPPFEFPPNEPLKREDVRLSFELSEEERTITVYRVVPRQEADEEYARSIAERLGVIAEAKRDDVHGGYDIESEMGAISVPDRDGFTFRGTGESITPLPQFGEDELKQAAEEFLKQRDLLPPHAVFDNISRPDPSGKVVDVGFYDERVAPGTDVPFIIMSYEDGTLARISYNWPQLEPVGEYPLVSEKEAFERVFRFGEVYPAVLDDPVELHSVFLFYYGVETEEGETVLVPLYQFQGPDVQWIWVSALPDEYVQPTPTSTT
jgi:hypothetical protein